MLRRIQETLSIYKDLPRDIYFIALSRFILGLGNFIIPFLVLLLTQKLGYSEAIASTFVMIVMTAFMIGGVFGGKLADAFGHKNIMVLGELIGGTILFVCGFFPEHHYLAPALILIAYLFGGASVPAGNALAANLSNTNNRSAVMSLSYLAYNVGSAVGSLVAGYLFWYSSSLIYWGNGLASVIGILLVAWFVKEPKYTKPMPTPEREDLELEFDPEQDAEGSVWQVLKERPHLWVFGIACTLLYIAITQMTVLAPLYMAHLFGKEGAVVFGQLMTIACVAVVVLTPILVKVTHGQSELKSLSICGVLLAGGYLVVMNFDYVPVFFFAWLILAAAEVLLVTNENVYIANQSPRSHRGRISGVINTIKNIGMLPAYVVMGIMVQGIGYSMTWSCIIAIAVLSSLMLLFMSKRQHSSVAAVQAH